MELATLTRPDAALRAYAKAVNRLKQLEQEAEMAFAEYQHAQDACHQEGITADLQLTPGMAAAHSAWKQARDRSEARTIAHDEYELKVVQ